MAPTPTPESLGYSATREQVLKRLRRIEGQVRGIERTVEEERYCIDVLTQISAVQAALDKVGWGSSTTTPDTAWRAPRPTSSSTAPTSSWPLSCA
jgi:hypothetical protein